MNLPSEEKKLATVHNTKKYSNSAMLSSFSILIYDVRPITNKERKGKKTSEICSDLLLRHKPVITLNDKKQMLKIVQQ